YGLPTPEKITLRLRAGVDPTDDQVAVHVQVDTLAAMATTVLHWHKTFAQANIDIVGGDNHKGPEITVRGIPLGSLLLIDVLAHPTTRECSTIRGHVLHGNDALHWPHQAAAGAINTPST
ncbi:hypothetical protein, partial [Actinokineospora inagensis]|uniref:hypothetical protein n=1 Tax=Actinokineospora inagensis TaxID=103730 RepID=UPI00054E69AB